MIWFLHMSDMTHSCVVHNTLISVQRLRQHDFKCLGRRHVFVGRDTHEGALSASRAAAPSFCGDRRRRGGKDAEIETGGREEVGLIDGWLDMAQVMVCGFVNASEALPTLLHDLAILDTQHHVHAAHVQEKDGVGKGGKGEGEEEGSPEESYRCEMWVLLACAISNGWDTLANVLLRSLTALIDDAIRLHFATNYAHHRDVFTPDMSRTVPLQQPHARIVSPSAIVSATATTASTTAATASATAATASASALPFAALSPPSEADAAETAVTALNVERALDKSLIAAAQVGNVAMMRMLLILDHRYHLAAPTRHGLTRRLALLSSIPPASILRTRQDAGKEEKGNGEQAIEHDEDEVVSAKELCPIGLLPAAQHDGLGSCREHDQGSEVGGVWGTELWSSVNRGELKMVESTLLQNKGKLPVLALAACAPRGHAAKCIHLLLYGVHTDSVENDGERGEEDAESSGGGSEEQGAVCACWGMTEAVIAACARGLFLSLSLSWCLFVTPLPTPPFHLSLARFLLLARSLSLALALAFCSCSRLKTYATYD